MTDLQCEKCGWIGAESAFIVVQYHDDADLQCPSCNQIICAEEVDWKEHCSHAENDLADVRRDLAAAVGRVIAANERSKAAEAEVAGWRRAVRWVDVGDGVWGLRFAPANGAQYHEFGLASEFADGWVIFLGNGFTDTATDRDTACAKVCELLGIPVVLPVGGE
jgi:hypothetical protein